MVKCVAGCCVVSEINGDVGDVVLNTVELTKIEGSVKRIVSDLRSK